MAEIPGTPGGDVLFGTRGDDRIKGFGGADRLVGLTGNDVLDGGAAGDLLHGGAGKDLLHGGAGRDVLPGGPGDDVLDGGPGADLLRGGVGDDVLVIGGGGDRVFGGADRDTFMVFPRGQLATSGETALVIETGSARHRFVVELPETPVQQALGLMFRPDLAANGGMLFDFGREEPAAFWMRNTFVSLDLLFIDADGRVVQVVERATPLSEEIILSDQPVRAVLEVRAGTAEELGIGVGGRVLHPLFGTGDVAPAASGDGAAADVGGVPAPPDDEPARGGNDTIGDFTRGEDAINLTFFGGRTFADIDTNGDGVLDDGDGPVSVTDDGAIVLDLGAPAPDPAVPYTLTVAGVTGLTADDFVPVPAEANGEAAWTARATARGPRTDDGPPAEAGPTGADDGVLDLAAVFTGTDGGISGPAVGVIGDTPEGGAAPVAPSGVAEGAAAGASFDDLLGGIDGAAAATAALG